ncbi:MAG TPA: metallopeptidase TldD-related protein [Candidatus Limnocylindrales bacterium]|nr:metallopeptidase TldD-related protein [Candidatus Limnocylindrales bacterium]
MSDQPLDVCERVLSRVPSEAEAEVTFSTGADALTRFATSFIHQNVADAAQRVHLRVALDGRVAEAVGNQTDDDALDRLVRSATEAARLRPVDPGWPGLAPPAPAPTVDHWDDATARAAPDARAERIGAFVTAADGLESAGFCSTTGETVGFANSAGQRLSGRASTAIIDGIARTGTSDGSGRAASVRIADLDGGAVGAAAVRRARESASAGDLQPGRYEVVLEPDCVVDVLTFLTLHGFNGRAVEEGRSFARLGEAQFDASISLADDVEHPMAVGIGFDAEGTPKRRVELVREGVTSGLVHDRRTAKALGSESTGNAVAGAGPWGALPANLVLEPGSVSRDELVGSVERGVLVTDFWYTRILDPRTQVVTGLTRNGVWLIEDGQVVRPVTNMRFTQSFLEALSPGNVRGVGSEATLVGGAVFGIGAYVVPALHLASWNFTGGAKG